MVRMAGRFLVVAAVAVAAGCDRGASSGATTVEPMPAQGSVAHAEVTPTVKRERAQAAKKLFVQECAGCHGEKGRGDGPAAAVLTESKPRNFIEEKFKFRSTPSGEPPLRKDVYDTISKGLPGSGMPAFSFLTEDQRWALTDHVRGLAGIENVPDPEPIKVGAERPGGPEAVARGRAVYQKVQCFACHGQGGKGDGPGAKELKDTAGRPIKVRDLTDGVYRRGDTIGEMHMRFRTGLDGTPMPSYDESISQDEGWDLAHFIASLKVPKPDAPTDPVERGRLLVNEKRCDACHKIGGTGGKVGPNLDVSAQKLQFDWVKAFLSNPRAHGKVYPVIPYRMPDLGLKPDEVEAVLAYLAKNAGRTYPEASPSLPPTAAPSKEVMNQGTLLYVLKCAECHNLGKTIPLMEAKQQGPDLAKIAERVRFDWIPRWIADPKAIDADAHMIDTNLTTEEIEAIRAFLYTVSAAETAKAKK